MSAAARRLVAAVLALAPILGGCAMPPLRLEGGDAIPARESLAAFLTNRGIRELYEGRPDDARRSAEFALEWAYVREADELRMHAAEPGYRPQLVRFTAEPGMPAGRARIVCRRPGELARALSYPVIGLPLDLVELPFKAILAVPVLGDAFMITAIGAPLGAAIIGLAACDSGAGLVLFGLGAGTLVAEGAAFLTINGLGWAVYGGRFKDRAYKGWTPYAPYCDGRSCALHTHHGGPRFFVNARQIDWGDALPGYRADGRIPRLRGEIERAREHPLDWRNREVDEWNEAIRAGANPFVPVAPAR